MSPRTRRAVLQTSGVAIAGLLAGCHSGGASETATESASTTVDTDAVYVGETGFENRSIVALGREEGTERWRHQTAEQGISDTIQAGVRGPPTVVAGGLHVVAADGIRAFGR